MFIEKVNTIALVRAAETIVGPQATNAIQQMYAVIDRAMKDGYDLGKIDAEQGVDERLDLAFDAGFSNGYNEGFSDGTLDASGPEGQAYDEGYIDGVSDARARPDVADSNVMDIINLLASETINGEHFDDGGPYNEPSFDISLVRDSGDEDERVQDEA